VPAVAAEQQPDRQAIADEQLLTQRLAAHAVEVPGQSPMAAQPHWPPPVTTVH
jgi:hypothetical protein